MTDRTNRIEPDSQISYGENTSARRDPWQYLSAWGWTEAWAQKALDHGGVVEGPVSIDSPERDATEQPGDGRADEGPLVPGRVVRHVHHRYDLVSAISSGTVSAEVSGAFSYRAAGPADYPTAGDWVLFRPGGRIETLLPRNSAISRGVAGEETLEQVIAANVDVIFLVFGLDGGRNFTVGMVERSLVAAWNSGGRPVVVLNKSDCADADHIERTRLEAENHAPGISVHIVSAHRGDGLEALRGEVRAGETVGLLGKSGVGKSALVNGLARLAASAGSGPAVPAPGPAPAATDSDAGAELARTGEQRRGDRQGRHTTTNKSLYMLPGGIIVADVPGLRELQLWGDDQDLAAAFPDINELAAECRFGDCAHTGEPGCRVQEAIATGELPLERYERYLEYRRELAYLERRRDQRAGAEEQKKWKRIAMEIRRIKKR